MRAQAEFIVVIVIASIVIVAFYLGASTLLANPVPQAAAADQRDVKTAVEAALRDLTVQVVKISETRGGFLFPAEAAFSLQQPVNYWQKCNTNLVPDREALESHMADVIKTALVGRLQAGTLLPGKDIDFGFLQASATLTIREDKIDVEVALPTNVSGYPLRSPYTVSIPSRYGRIYDFGNDFVISAVKPADKGGRQFEVFTAVSILMARYLPTYGILTQCGETIFRTPDQVAQELDSLIRQTIATTRWWEKMTDQEGYDETKNYAIDTVNRKQYKDLQLRLSLPDGFRVEGQQAILQGNYKPIYTSFLGALPVCETVYNFAYRVSYPLIFTVRDDLLKNNAQFAVWVSLNETTPLTGSECQAVIAPQACIWEPVTQSGAAGNDPLCNSMDTITNCQVRSGSDKSFIVEKICRPSDTTPVSACTENARIKVTDTVGQLLPTARAIFGACPLGPPDQNGVMEGPVAPGTHDLVIFEPSGDYGFVQKTLDADQLRGTYTLPRIPTTRVLFTELNLSGGTYIYTVTPPGSLPQTTTVRYTNCSAMPAKPYNEMIMVRFIADNGAGLEYAVTNMNPETASQCRDESACTSCDENNQATCEACGRCYTSSTYTQVDVPYIPEGSYQVSGQLRETIKYLVRAVAGSSSYALGAEDGQTVSVNLYRALALARRQLTMTAGQDVEIYDTTFEQNRRHSTEMAAACGFDPVTEERPLSFIKIHNNECSPESMRSLLNLYKGAGCLIAEQINDVLSTADAAERMRNINTLLRDECGAEIRGCG